MADDKVLHQGDQNLVYIAGRLYGIVNEHERLLKQSLSEMKVIKQGVDATGDRMSSFGVGFNEKLISQSQFKSLQRAVNKIIKGFEEISRIKEELFSLGVSSYRS